MNATEFMFKQSNWKVPKLIPGDVIRFNYWNSEFNDWYGNRGTVIKVRYLCSKPLKHKDREIVRGSVHYTIQTSRGIRSYYNQRMSNVEIIHKKELTSLKSGV
jgi:predicted methyltransferase